jgi:hypothetical protein
VSKSKTPTIHLRGSPRYGYRQSALHGPLRCFHTPSPLLDSSDTTAIYFKELNILINHEWIEQRANKYPYSALLWKRDTLAITLTANFNTPTLPRSRNNPTYVIHRLKVTSTYTPIKTASQPHKKSSAPAQGLALRTIPDQ